MPTSLRGLFAQDLLAAQPNLCELFRGKRVMVTMSKDNDLAWIRDWVEFHTRNHGCDAVLLYDNGSTQYEAAKLQEIVAAIPGVDAALVVTWPFSYGPGGGGGMRKVWVALNGLEHQVWDFRFLPIWISGTRPTSHSGFGSRRPQLRH